ncbi:MAG TPA: hypothetical protein VEB67_01205, partial [Nitrososphaerales archaeon]|nr:hypothetical protein [Nitrososphaerales archaeon]
MEAGDDGRVRLYRWLTRVLVVLIAVAVVLGIAWVVLQWSIAEAVYSAKAGLDWFGITFYHDYIFVAAGLFGLLVIYPRPGGSDLWRLGGVFFSRVRPVGVEEELPRVGDRMNVWLWALWQTVKWTVAFYAFASTGAFPGLGPIMNPIMMMTMNLGSWGNVPTIFALPVAPASGAGFVTLMPSLSIQYAVLSYVLSAVLLVFAVRMVIRFFGNLATRRSEVWLRELLLVLAAVLLEVILGAPYWLMNIATPYVYGITWSALLLVGWGVLYLSRRGPVVTRRTAFKGVAVVLMALLLIQVAIGAFYYFNWNNNYLSYSWYPQTQKQITVTRWAAGLDSIHVN